MLKLRRVRIDTYGENIALVARNCVEFRPGEYLALKRVEITHDGGRLFATLAITDDEALVGPDQLGLNEQAFRLLDLPEGAPLAIAPANPADSIDAVRRKIVGHILSRDEIVDIVSDISAHRYSEMEIAAFIVACARFLSTEEMLELTRAMADAGNRLDWATALVADKHSIGGIPGNRTSMVVVPIVAAHGMTIPKTSSRAITSPAGTADTMEVLARVDLSMREMQDVVGACNGCLVWGGHVNLSPSDDIMISVERPLAIDTWEQMVASIMSKKLAAGSNRLLVDLPLGPTAKVRSVAAATRLRKLFEYVADESGIEIDVTVTDGTQPIGQGIGPVLEARDVMAVLAGKPEAPGDLREKSLRLAGRLLEFDPDLRGGSGYERARQLLETGAALRTMERIIEAQGLSQTTHRPGDLVREVAASRNGEVSAVDCRRLGRIARLAGAPMDKGAGIDLLKKTGDTVRAGEPLYRIHACFKSDFGFATELAEEDTGYTIG